MVYTGDFIGLCSIFEMYDFAYVIHLNLFLNCCRKLMLIIQDDNKIHFEFSVIWLYTNQSH